MRTDRELLELAAKAAGYEVRWHDRWDCFVHATPHNITNPASLAGMRHTWAPLDDDGDALRLLVKLRLEIMVFREHVTCYYSTGWCDELYGDDELAATRRAIVRAAAEIGAKMQGE